MKVVVTGGAGFIGASLCAALLRSGVGEVVVVDDLSTGDAANLAGLPVRLVEGSILDRALLADACSGAASVVHLAARPSVPRSLTDPLATHEVNATGTVRVLEAAREAAAHVVVASSSSVYGANREIPKREDTTPLPLSPYAASKLAAESYALAYQASFALPALALRFFNVFGPGQSSGHAYAAVIPRFITAALAGEPLTVYGDGRQTRDFTYVDSVSDVLVDAVRRRVTCEGPVNLAFGTRTTIAEVARLLGDVLGRDLDVRHVAPRLGDVRHSQADQTRLRALFPDARPRDLRTGLVETVTSFAARSPTQISGLA